MDSNAIEGRIEKRGYYKHSRFHYKSLRISVSLAQNRNRPIQKLKVSIGCFIYFQFTDHGLYRLNERLALFRHDYNSTNILQMINSASEINDDTLVEIVFTGKT